MTRSRPRARISAAARRAKWVGITGALVLPLAFAGAATPAVGSPDALPVVPVRCELVGGYGRLSFLWSEAVDYKMTREGPDIVVAFQRPARIETGALAHERSACARWVAWRPVEAGVIVSLRLPEGNEARDARVGNRIVIDVFPTPQPLRPPPAPSPPQAVAAEDSAEIAASASPAASPAAGSGEERDGRTEATLRFSWPQPTASAVAVRDRTMWIVFDRPSHQDPVLLRRIAGEGRIAAVRQRRHPGATILELTMAEPVFARLERDGLAWIVHLSATPTAASADPIVPLPVAADRRPSRLLLPVAEPGEPVAFSDPAGGTLVFVPLQDVGRGISRGFAYGAARLLTSPQGIAVAPLADDLSVRSGVDGVELSRPAGFAATPSTDSQRVLARLQAADRVDRVVPAPDWPEGTLADVQARQEATLGSDAAESDHDRALTRLARFYLAAGLAAEALGTTETRLALRPELTEDPESRFVAGVARYGLGRIEEAGRDLATAPVAATDEGRMWATLVRHAGGEHDLDRSSLPAWTTLIATYPKPLAQTAGLGLLAAAVDAGEVTTARNLLAALRLLAPTPAGTAALDYQDGRLEAAAGEPDKALAAWDRIPADLIARPAAEAELARTALLRQESRMSPAEAADALAGLQVRWRGDRVEFATLRDLGQAQADGGDGLAALQTWRDAVSLYDREPESRELGRKMAAFFRDAFTNGALDGVPPWKAVLLFDEFKELVPADQSGIVLLRRYADLLIAADLLPAATEVLERVLKSPLSPHERAETGLRLAEVRLDAAAAEQALDALKGSEQPGLGADLQAARRRTAARAQLALGRPAAALSLVDADPSQPADTVRLAAQRASGDWAGAAATLQRLRPQSLDVAAALTLAKDEPGLARLRDDPTKAGAGAPDETLEAVRLMAETARPVPPQPAAIARTVADAERLVKLARQATVPPAPDAPR
ncbi:MAG: hypothetical protein U1E66_03830 [Rhodospirillales bacterium]